MKILYVSQYFPPEMGAPAARVSELARYWVAAGHQVTVLTGFPNHPTGAVPAEYRGKLWRLVLRETLDGVQVLRTWLVPLPNRKPWERILNYGSFWLSSSLSGMFISQPDVVVATSPQLLVGLTGWWLARLKGAPFVLEVRDLWPESLAAVGVGGARSLLNLVLGAIAGFLYKRCDHLVVVTPAFREHLVSRWQVPRERISVMENSVETRLFAPADDRDATRRAFGLEDRFVVSYIGTLGMAHGLETVLEAAAVLQSEQPQVLFLLVGEGAERERLAGIAADQRLENVRFVSQVPRGEIPALIRASDLGLVVLRKSEIFRTVIPTKMLEFMACARAVVLAVDGQARELLETAGAGAFVEPESTTALAAMIAGLSARSESLHEMGICGRAYVEAHLSRARIASSYLTLLQGLAP